MSAATGAVVLGRFALRRDRVRIALWVAGLVGLSAVTASSIQGLYADRAALAEYAATVQSNQAIVAMSGPPRALDSYGGRIAFEIWQFSVAIGIMAVLLVGRHTRAEEETGRADLVQSAPVGRHARSLAAAAVGVAASVVVGVGVASGLAAVGLPASGSIALGASFATTGAVFAGVALLVAQVTEHSRTATGLAIAVVALAYVTRAVGDAGSGTLSWLSPLGWMQATRPFADERWWPLGLSALVAALLVVAALAVERRRDVGVGLVRPRPGPGRGAATLSGPWALAWRLQRAGLVAWGLGAALGGAAMGSVASSADDLVGDNEGIRDYLAALGGADLVDVFLATILTYLALAIGGFAIQATLRARSEEVSGRIEPLLAAGTSRIRWATGHLSVALTGPIAILAASGAGIGLAYGLTIDDLTQVPRLAVAALAFAPAVWLMVGVAMALHGAAPRFTAVAWAVLGLAVVVAVLGEALGLPGAVRDLSPLAHVPGVPAEGLRWAPLATLTALAALLITIGLASLRHRDLG